MEIPTPYSFLDLPLPVRRQVGVSPIVYSISQIALEYKERHGLHNRLETCYWHLLRAF